MRIHFYTKYDRQGASSRYRTYQYQPFLKEAGVQSRCLPLFGNDYLQDRYTKGRRGSRYMDFYQQRWQDMERIKDCELAVIEKELLPYLPAMFEKKAFQAARHRLLDFDDAVFMNYQLHPNPLVRLVLRKKIDHLMAWSDGVIGGSRFLCEYARQHAPQVWYVPTTVDVEKYLLHDHNHDGLVSIGWIGTPWSARYLPVIRNALQQLAKEVSLRFLVVGANAPQWDGVPSQTIPWSEDKEAEWIRWMDIGIMPLIDSPFERGKCGLKILQYMAAGVVPVASDIGGNRDLITHGVDGFLCTREEEWVEYLLELARNPTRRAEMGRAARVKAENEFSLSVWAPRLAGIYREVGERL